MRYLKLNTCRSETICFFVRDFTPDTKHGFAIVQRYARTNRLLHDIKILLDTKLDTCPVVEIQQIYIVSEPEGFYSLWVDCSNYKAKAGFLAGILLGNRTKWDRIRRKRERKNRRNKRNY